MTLTACGSLFQSTLSVRRATWTIRFDVLARLVISIHALRKESDNKRLPHVLPRQHFNPRSP